MGALVGASAVVGVIGSLAYPVIRKHIGLGKTGLVGFVTLIATLALSLGSGWLQKTVHFLCFHTVFLVTSSHD